MQVLPTKLIESPSTVAEASESSLAHLVAEHGMRALSRRLNDALRPVGITSAQFCLLSLLYNRVPPTVRELAEKVKMHRMHVSAQVSLLVRRNLVTSAMDTRGGNQRRLKLTPHASRYNRVARCAPALAKSRCRYARCF
jgi:DNA-binding MarR family transcriptional regulator